MRKRYNWHITAVCSGKNAEKLLQIPVDEVVDYTEQAFDEKLAKSPKFDVVFDFLGGTKVLQQSKSLLSTGGCFITAVGDRKWVGDRALSCCEFTSSACRLLSRSICCCKPYSYVMSGAYPPMTETIWRDIVIKGKARALLAEEVPFIETRLREALKRVASHHPGGRVVINMEHRAATESKTEIKEK